MKVSSSVSRARSIGGPVLMTLLVIGVGASVLWANLWKSELRVSDVRVAGNLVVTGKDILTLADITKEQKLYSVDLLSAERRVLRNPFIKSASINREAPNRISITVVERVPIAAVIMDGIEYVDATGVVLPATRSENIFDLPVLTGAFRPDEFVPGKQITRKDVRSALTLLATAKELGGDMYRRISEIHIEPGKDMISYSAEWGVPILFGEGDIGKKLVKLDGFWRDIVPHHGAHELVYVDLRFEDQVVVKWNHDKDENHPSERDAAKVPRTKKS